MDKYPLRFIETLISFIRAFVYCLYMPGLKENYLYFFFVNIQWQSQPSQGDFFARITLQHEPWLSEMGTCSGIGGNLIFIYPTLFTFPSMTCHRIKSVVSYKICIITKH
jgi:hypothetical protein